MQTNQLPKALPEPKIPENFREVSKDHFYATVGQLAVHPRAEREASYWETPYQILRGVTTPGYMCADSAGKYTTESHYYTNL